MTSGTLRSREAVNNERFDSSMSVGQDSLNRKILTACTDDTSNSSLKLKIRLCASTCMH